MRTSNKYLKPYCWKCQKDYETLIEAEECKCEEKEDVRV